MPHKPTPLIDAAPVSQAAAEPSQTPSLDAALAPLETYDHGSGRASLLAIDEAVVASLKDPAARAQWEQRLAALLKREISPVAKEYVCSKLALIGSAHSVSALAELLDHNELGHAARAALQVMPCLEAGQALRECLARVSGLAKVGVINSLGARPAAANVSALAALLKDSDPQIAAAAAAALGEIGTPAAAQSLAEAQSNSPEPVRQSVADARLACAERLLASGKKADALAIYKALTDPRHAKHVQLAARSGQLRVLQQK